MGTLEVQLNWRADIVLKILERVIELNSIFDREQF
jgi:hypothetical protein